MEDSLRGIYSPLSFIKSELEARRKDKDLIKKVEELFGSDVPVSLANKPKAMLSRSITTPNKEVEYFDDIAKGLDFQPVVLEYNGKFVAKNIEKYFLCNLHFCQSYQQKKNQGKKIVDFNKWEGKNMHDITLADSKPLRNFHKELLEKASFGKDIEIIDITEWFNKVRISEKGYYFYFLSLFIVHGALFENYLFDHNEEKVFFQQKIFPSFLKVSDFFGVKPLIFPLLPITNENRDEWHYYGEDLEKMV